MVHGLCNPEVPVSSCSRPPADGQRHLVATPNAVAVYEWFTPWMPATGVSNVKAVLKRRALTGNFRAQVAYQTAAVRPDLPDTPAKIGSAQAGAGEYCTGVVDVSAGTATAGFIRYGAAIDLSAAGDPGQADVALDVTDDACGSPIGTATLALSTTTTANAFAAVTPWVPAQHAAKIRAAIVISGLSGNFQCRLAYRTAATSKEAPGAWSTTFDTWRTADGEANTGDLSPTSANEMWIQFGVQHALSSGAALGQAIVSVALTGRKL